MEFKMKSNTIILSLFGAIILAMASYLIYDNISRQSDEKVAQKVYQVQQMSTYELNKPTKDPLILQERNRRNNEVNKSLWLQNRD
jgi:hypothetical protein